MKLHYYAVTTYGSPGFATVDGQGYNLHISTLNMTSSGEDWLLLKTVDYTSVITHDDFIDLTRAVLNKTVADRVADITAQIEQLQKQRQQLKGEPA